MKMQRSLRDQGSASLGSCKVSWEVTGEEGGRIRLQATVMMEQEHGPFGIRDVDHLSELLAMLAEDIADNYAADSPPQGRASVLFSAAPD